MDEQTSRRSGRRGALIVAAVVIGSTIGVLAWHVLSNQSRPVIDVSGFDLNLTPGPHQTTPIAAGSRPFKPTSSLEMLKTDSGIRIGSSGAPASQSPTATAVNEIDRAYTDFRQEARKHEIEVHDFAVKMTRKYPIFHQYGKDWMSHPDLRRLTENYWRNRDPVAFLISMAKAPSLGLMVKKYAGEPAIREFITEGLKKAPGDLTSSAMDLMSNDAIAKKLISNIVAGLGLPPSVAAMINGRESPSALDQKRIVSDLMSSAAAQAALKQQNQPTSPSPDQH